MANNEPGQNNTDGKSATWSPSMGTAILAALVGGLLGFGIIQGADPIFKMEELPEMGLNPTGTQIKKFIAAQKAFYSTNYAAEFAVFAGCIGLVFVGVTASIRRIPCALLAAALGAIAAGATGYYAGLVTGEELALSKDQSLQNTALVSSLIWVATAAAIAFGGAILQVGAKASVNAALGGLVAGIMIVVVVLLVFSFPFTGANLSDQIPITMVQRLVWSVAASVTFGATMAMVLKPAKPSGARPEENTGNDAED